MAGFRFRLESLLKARRHAERERQRDVAELERRRRELQATLRRQQATIDAGRSTMGSALVGAIDLAALRTQASSTIQTMRHAQRILIELAGVHKRLDAARGELTEAMRQRRVVERLRERRLEAWRRAMSRAEDRELDELAVAAARKDT